MPDQKAKAVDVGGGSGKVEVGGGKLESQDGRRSGRSVMMWLRLRLLRMMIRTGRQEPG